MTPNIEEDNYENMSIYENLKEIDHLKGKYIEFDDQDQKAQSIRD
jgi:hypothetical protein